MKSYQSRDWLYFHYWLAMMSWRQIAKQFGVGKTTINSWAKRLNVPSRTRKEGVALSKANHCHLSQEDREWIDGELLGDGGIYTRSPYSAHFGYSSKYEEYINYISDTLFSFGVKQTGETHKGYNEDMNCFVFHYSSLEYVELLPIRKRWYPKGKKIIPWDLKLTPLTCRQWHIGDGCLAHPKKSKPFIHLSTQSFSVSDVEWLVKNLTKIGFLSTRQPSSNCIHISSYSTKQFLNYIGPSPIKCYNYKFQY